MGTLIYTNNIYEVEAMGKKKKKKIDLDNIKPEEKMKYEIAKELGYLDKVLTSGWESLTAKESGRIGGVLARKKKEAAKAMKNDSAEM